MWQDVAADEWIASVSFRTRARRCVINDRATRQETAGSRTRISTLFSDAGLVSRTVRVYRALGSAIRWNTDVILHAGARWRVADSSAHGIGSAR